MSRRRRRRIGGRLRWRPELLAYCGLTVLILFALSEQMSEQIAPRSGSVATSADTAAARRGAGEQAAAPPPAARVAPCRVTHVYDGDTVELRCGGESRKARLTGFDTPETRDARCPGEAALGHRATARLRGLLAGRTVEAVPQGHDRYGRDLVALSVNGRSVSGLMIAEGLAVPYAGGTRIDWCARLR